MMGHSHFLGPPGPPPPPPPGQQPPQHAPPSEDEEEDHDEDEDEEEEEDHDVHHFSQGLGAAVPQKPLPHLPRVKLLLMAEYEYFLCGVLDALQQSGCAQYPTATNTNPWATAFRLTYEGIASDCHLPTGKNRYHKFKGKMEDLWTQMERQVMQGYKNANHAPYALGLEQLATFRQARENLKAGIKPPSTSGQQQQQQQPEPMRGHAGAAAPLQMHHGAAAAAALVQHQNHNHAAKHPLSPAGHNTATKSSSWKRRDDSIQHLERTIYVLSQHPPHAPAKLPNPLQELALLQLRPTTTRQERDLMEPYYRHALQRFLEQVKKQLATAPTPLLWTFLEGLDVLRQIHDTHEERVQALYRQTLQKYLERIRNTLSPPPPQGSARKKPRYDTDHASPRGASAGPKKPPPAPV